MEQTSTNKKVFFNYINVLRGVAMIIIVSCHCFSPIIANENIRKIFLEFFSGGTTLFVFIAGFLFEYLTRNKFNYKNFLKKKFINVIMPYIITSTVGISLLYLHIYNRVAYDDFSPVVKYFALITTGNIYNEPLWFIGMITIFFIVSPLLRRINKNNATIILIVSIIISLFVSRNYVIEGTGFHLWWQTMAYRGILFIHFLSAWVLGMYFSLFNEKTDKIQIKYIALIYLIVSSLDIGCYFKFGFWNPSITKLPLAILLLVIFKKYDKELISKKRINNALDIVAKYSFGIFFIHQYLIDLFDLIIKKIVHIPISFMINNAKGFTHFVFIGSKKFIFVFFGSIIILWIIKTILEKLGYKNTRMFIGV